MLPVSAVLKILLYVVLVAVCAAIFAPIAYAFGQWLDTAGYTDWLAKFPFHRYFSRAAQVSAVILLPLFAWWLGIWRLSALGIEKNRHLKEDFAVGFGAAFLPIIVMSVIYIGVGAYSWKDDPTPMLLLRVIGTAAVVSAFEEFFFRGILLGLFLRMMRSIPAAIFVSIVFALVHFIRPVKEKIAPEDVHAMTGFEYLGIALSGIGGSENFWWGALTLFIAGLILAWVRLATKSLWLGIGIHAGWIFGQQGFHIFAKYRVDPPDSMLPWLAANVVSGAVPVGLLALLGLAGTAGMIAFSLRNRPPKSPT